MSQPLTVEGWEGSSPCEGFGTDFLPVEGLGAWTCLWSDVEEPSLCQPGHGLSWIETQHQPSVGFWWDLVVGDFPVIQTCLEISPWRDLPLFSAFPSHQQFLDGLVMLCPVGAGSWGGWGCDSHWRKVPEDLPSEGAGAEDVKFTPCPMKPKYFQERTQV